MSVVLYNTLKERGYDAVHKWTNGPILFEKEIILIPVNFNKNHLILITVNNNQSRVIKFTSLLARTM